MCTQKLEPCLSSLLRQSQAPPPRPHLRCDSRIGAPTSSGSRFCIVNATAGYTPCKARVFCGEARAGEDGWWGRESAHQCPSARSPIRIPRETAYCPCPYQVAGSAQLERCRTPVWRGIRPCPCQGGRTGVVLFLRDLPVAVRIEHLKDKAKTTHETGQPPQVGRHDVQGVLDMHVAAYVQTFAP
jgi:hypothetical protein